MNVEWSIRATGSRVGSGIHAGANRLGWSQQGTIVAMVGGCAISGGFGASISGGDFWHGFGTAATTGLMNHVLHNSGGTDPPVEFKEGKSDVEMVLFDLIGGGEGVTLSIGYLEMRHGETIIRSSGGNMGYGVGTPISLLDAVRGDVVFHKAVSGNDLASIFNSAPYIRVERYGAFLKFGRVSGYTSNSFANPVWSVRGLGVGFSAGVFWVHDKANFQQLK